MAGEPAKRVRTLRRFPVRGTVVAAAGVLIVTEGE
jgi:hypothetical protein